MKIVSTIRGQNAQRPDVKADGTLNLQEPCVLYIGRA
jgi:hypothetical protein